MLLILGIIIAMFLTLIMPWKFIRLAGKDPYKSYTESKFIGRVMCRVGRIKVHIKGQENVTSKGPYVIIANHQSNQDPVLMVTFFPVDYAIVTPKIALSKVPVLHKLVDNNGWYFLDKDDPRGMIKIFSNSTKRIKNNGDSFLMFPEGRRTFKNEMDPFQAGAFYTAEKTGVPIVPVVIIDAHKTWEQRKWYDVRKKHIYIHFLPEIETTGKKKEQLQVECEAIMRAEQETMLKLYHK